MFKKILKTAVFLLIFLWVVGYVAGYGAFIVNIIEAKKTSLPQETDAIIVLTGGNDRIKTGLNLFDIGVSNKLFITGVHKSVSKSDIIKLWKGDKTLPNCCIILDYKATNTIENAIETNIWITKNNIESMILVTSAYHMDRALLEFRSNIKDIEITPYEVKAKRSLSDVKFWKITFSEYNKFLFRYIITSLERY